MGIFNNAKADLGKTQGLKELAEKGLNKAQEKTKIAEEIARLEKNSAQISKGFQETFEDTTKLRLLFSAIQNAKNLELLIDDKKIIKDYPSTSPLLTLQIIINTFISKKIASQKLDQSPNKKDSRVIGIDFTLDEQQQVTATENGIVIIKNQLSQEIKRINRPTFLTNIAFLDTNRLIAAELEESGGVIRIFNTSNKSLQEWEAHDSVITCLSLDSRRRLLLSCDGNSVTIWNTSGQKINEIRADKFPSLKESSISSASFTLENHIVTIEFNGKVRFWKVSEDPKIEVQEKENILDLSAMGQPKLIVASPDGQLLATLTSQEGIVGLWDINGRQIGQFGKELGKIKSIKFNNDGKSLAIIRENGALQLYPIFGLADLIVEGCKILNNSDSISEEQSKICIKK